MVGVYPPNYNEPAIFSQIGGGAEVFINFYKFYPSTNFNHSIFDVPSMCIVLCALKHGLPTCLK